MGAVPVAVAVLVAEVASEVPGGRVVGVAPKGEGVVDVWLVAGDKLSENTVSESPSPVVAVL